MNTIYENYTKISNRIYFFKNSKHIWEPLVKPIRILRYEVFDFFIINSNSGYILCEGLTGNPVLYQRELQGRILRRLCLRRFIKALPDILDKRGGVAAINQAIVNFIFDNDQLISPRYEPKEHDFDKLQEVPSSIQE
jgi:hypothetical protein